jgi:hypothetical protein
MKRRASVGCRLEAGGDRTRNLSRSLIRAASTARYRPVAMQAQPTAFASLSPWTTTERVDRRRADARLRDAMRKCPPCASVLVFVLSDSDPSGYPHDRTARVSISVPEGKVLRAMSSRRHRGVSEANRICRGDQRDGESKRCAGPDADRARMPGLGHPVRRAFVSWSDTITALSAAHSRQRLTRLMPLRPSSCRGAISPDECRGQTQDFGR